jgi:putative serine protease PepD
LTDPWRDPAAPSAVVLRAPAGPPPDDPNVPRVHAGDGGGRRGVGLVFVVALVTSLLAGALGGTLGYVFASRGAGHTVLGTGNTKAPSAAQRPPDSLAGVVQKVLPSVVTIKVGVTGGYDLGSGFVVSKDGYVITNDHVVAGLTGDAQVTFSDSSTTTAKLVGEDPESDLAVLKTNRGNLTPVEFGDSEQVAVGDPVLAIGSPLALDNTVTYGIVSALNRTMVSSEPGGPTRYYAAIQTDAAINHGNSGGPLFDAAGRVIGINSFIRSLASDADASGNIGLGFAIPVNQAKRTAEEIIDSGKAKRTVIGAEVSSSYHSESGGVEITSVTAGGPAANAGLKAGDVVMQIDGVPMAESTDLIALIRKYAAGDSVKVVFQRGGASHTVQVTLTDDAK